MGIRAREVLGASLDTLRVESEAGLKPPLSCMNDGLQVATGASLGRGTIRVLDGNFVPAATFIDGKRKLRLQVKDYVLKKIKSDIDMTIKQFGTLTPEYFQAVNRSGNPLPWKISPREGEKGLPALMVNGRTVRAHLSLPARIMSGIYFDFAREVVELPDELVARLTGE